VGIRQPRNNAPITNDNSDVHERDGPKVTSDIMQAPSPASASADLRPVAEHRHGPVTGKLAGRALIALHHHRRAVDQRGHDLAQPLRTNQRGDVHRVDHIGE
jgi:hypothetical protein